MTKPEDKAREHIDSALTKAGWSVQDMKAVNLKAARGVAIREFSSDSGYGEADYLLYVDGKAAGVVEAKPVGSTLTGVEIQTDKYSKGLPATLPAYIRPLPFLYESTGVETHFTNGLDPEPKSRQVFNFHRPEKLAEWISAAGMENAPSLRIGRLLSKLLISCSERFGDGYSKCRLCKSAAYGPHKSRRLKILNSLYRKTGPARSFR